MPSARPRSRGMTLGKWTLAVVALLIGLPYAWAPIYHFPTPSAFAGAHFFNPYAGMNGTWQRANLHAHGRAWSGITNGQQSDEDVVAAYHSLGYSVAGISDYERIAADHGVPTIPLYEHGYNIGKHHQLAIGARRVEWFDILLLQSISQEQYVLDRVGKGADLVAIAHPSLRDAYADEDLTKLTGYQLMEVVNGPDEQGGLWDAALSSGHVVWALANDDTHDVDDARRTGVAWNMINAPTPSTADVISALRAGHTYAVAKKPHPVGGEDTMLTSVDVSDGQLVVACSGGRATFEFIGQNGAVRGTIKNALTASYRLTPADTYVRTVIRSGNTTMYLNPVIRYDGARLPVPASVVAAGATWLLRGTCALGGVLAVIAVRRRRNPTPAAVVEVRQAASDAKRKTA